MACEKKNKKARQHTAFTDCKVIMRKAHLTCMGQGQFWDDREIKLLIGIAAELDDLTQALLKALAPVLAVDMSQKADKKTLENAIRECQNQHAEWECKHESKHCGA